MSPLYKGSMSGFVPMCLYVCLLTGVHAGHVTVCVYICTCMWGSLPVALIKHNVAVALETAFLPWHSWGQGDVAGCDMILCGL